MDAAFLNKWYLVIIVEWLKSIGREDVVFCNPCKRMVRWNWMCNFACGRFSAVCRIPWLY